MSHTRQGPAMFVPASITCRSGAPDLGPDFACPAGQSLCKTGCIDVSRDTANCGTCGMACPQGYVCTKGACALSCASGEAACGGSCVILASDNANCGACGTVCPS